MPPHTLPKKNWGRPGRVSVRAVVGVCLVVVVLLLACTWYAHSARSHAELEAQIQRLQAALQDHEREASAQGQEGERHVHGHLLGLLQGQANASASLQVVHSALQRLEAQDQAHAAFHRDKVDALLHRHETAFAVAGSRDGHLRGPPELELVLAPDEPLDLPQVIRTDAATPSTLLLVVAGNRPQYLQRCLAAVVEVGHTYTHTTQTHAHTRVHMLSDSNASHNPNSTPASSTTLDATCPY